MDKTKILTELDYLAMGFARLGDFMKIPSDRIATDEELRVVRRYASVAMEINKLREFVGYLEDEES